MNTDVLLKFIEAGYTKQEIELMKEMEPTPEAAPMETEESTEQERTPTEQAEPSETDKINETLNNLLTVVGNLQKAVDGMQRDNVKHAESAMPSRMTADDVVKSFFGERKKA